MRNAKDTAHTKAERNILECVKVSVVGSRDAILTQGHQQPKLTHSVGFLSTRRDCRLIVLESCFLHSIGQRLCNRSFVYLLTFWYCLIDME